MSIATSQAVTITDVSVGETITDHGRDFPKTQPCGNRYRYSVEATFIGENGETFKSRIRGLSKPKLRARIDDTRRYVDGRMMRYEQYGGGWSQVISFSIGR